MISQNSSVLCRTCLTHHSPSGTTYLFGQWCPPWQSTVQKSSTTVIAEELFKLTKIYVNRNDDFSKYMCQTCWQNFRSSLFFIHRVQQSELNLKKAGKGEKFADSSGKSGMEDSWPKPIQLETTITSKNQSDQQSKNDVTSMKDPLSLEENCPAEAVIKQECVSDEETPLDSTDRVGMDDSYVQVKEEIDIKIEPEEMIQSHRPLQMEMNGHSPKQESLSGDEHSTKPTPTLNGEAEEKEELKPSPEKQEPLITPIDGAHIKEEPMDMELVNLNWTIPLDCMLCSKSFKCLTGLKAHVIAHHSYKAINRDLLQKNGHVQKVGRNFVCKLCYEIFPSLNTLETHLVSHPLPSCNNCLRLFKTRKALLLHKTKCKKTKQEAPSADASTSKPKTVQELRRVSTMEGIEENDPESDNDFECSECGEKFDDSIYLKIHSEIHHTEDKVSRKARRNANTLGNNSLSKRESSGKNRVVQKIVSQNRIEKNHRNNTSLETRKRSKIFSSAMVASKTVKKHNNIRRGLDKNYSNNARQDTSDR